MISFITIAMEDTCCGMLVLESLLFSSSFSVGLTEIVHRALTLILLASPEQTSQGKENEGINPVTKGFYDFIGRVVDYLDQNSFPYLYQN